MSKNTDIDPIPEEFATYEEAAEFWNTHDTTDYTGDFRTVDVESEFRGRTYEVELEEAVVESLQARARREGVSVSCLASRLLREQLVDYG